MRGDGTSSCGIVLNNRIHPHINFRFTPPSRTVRVCEKNSLGSRSHTSIEINCEKVQLVYAAHIVVRLILNEFENRLAHACVCVFFKDIVKQKREKLVFFFFRLYLPEFCGKSPAGIVSVFTVRVPVLITKI